MFDSDSCTTRSTPALTLFAFSSENWRRPLEEVAQLMGLFVEALDREIAELHANGVRLRFIGERGSLSVRLQARIAAAEEPAPAFLTSAVLPASAAPIPGYLTRFIGREAELAELDALLATEEVRLLTLIGLGGIGKTRIAC